MASKKKVEKKKYIFELLLFNNTKVQFTIEGKDVIDASKTLCKKYVFDQVISVRERTVRFASIKQQLQHELTLIEEEFVNPQEERKSYKKNHSKVKLYN